MLGRGQVAARLHDLADERLRLGGEPGLADGLGRLEELMRVVAEAS